jgi:plasmid maintenance system killer protein
MKVHEVFPILVAQDKVEVHQEFKDQYFEELKSLWFNGYENETPENSGRCSLHLNDNYLLLFKSLKKSICNYLDLLEVDYKKLNINFTKSWVGYHDKDIPQLKPHIHNGSDISFCYYLSSDDTSDKFCVHNSNSINEISGNIFETSNKYNLIKKFNKYNCGNYTITPYEGTVIVFPSNLLHSTLKKQNLKDRYVIAGDVKLCLKSEYNLYHQSIPHPSLWLQL